MANYLLKTKTNQLSNFLFCPALFTESDLPLIQELLHPCPTTKLDDWWDQNYRLTTDHPGQKVWLHLCQQRNSGRRWHFEMLLCWEWPHRQLHQIRWCWRCEVELRRLSLGKVCCSILSMGYSWAMQVPEAHPRAARETFTISYHVLLVRMWVTFPFHQFY